MKRNINPTPHSQTNLTPARAADKPAVRHTFTLGLDVDLRSVVVATQCDPGLIPPARKLTRAQLVAWVQAQVSAGHVVHTVSECCGFGYTLHEQLTATGAQSLITTPMRLSLERRRKNDRLDARELCVRLSRYLAGQRHELRPIRIPSVAERQRRELGRQREFWKRELRRLENHGRALRIEFEHETLPAASGRHWPRSAVSLCAGNSNR
jgi:transposase